MSEQNLLIVGGGPGGYAAAFLAADKGAQVTLIDEESQLGGVCLLRGCIPSKTLLHLAKLISMLRENRLFHFDFDIKKALVHTLAEARVSGLQVAGAHGGRGVVARLAQPLGQGGGPGRQDRAVVEHAVILQRQPGHDRRVGR